MRIEHVAVYTQNLEKLRAFYVRFFAGVSNQKYRNEKTGFESYFLRFPDNSAASPGARLEIMSLPGVGAAQPGLFTGITHFAVSVGSEAEVQRLTRELREAGAEVVSGPRRTGDGYYESCVLDPDGNRVEITV